MLKTCINTLQHSHETPTYTNWGPNQPDNLPDQHCVFLWGIHQGQWADYLCEASVEMKDFHLLDFFQEHQSSGGRDIHVLCEASALGCPGSDWAEAGASCYHRSPRSLSWREGNDYCQQQGGYVVEVKICNGFHIRRCKNNQMYRNQV